MSFIHWIASDVTDRNFLTMLASNFIVAAIAAIVIPWYLDWRTPKYSKIYLCDPITRKHEFALQATEGGNHKADLRPVITENFQKHLAKLKLVVAKKRTWQLTTPRSRCSAEDV